MAEAFTFEWDVLPQVIAEVRRRTLYPFKPSGPETDAEMTENPTTVWGAAFHDGRPVGRCAVLDEATRIEKCVDPVSWARQPGSSALGYRAITARTAGCLQFVGQFGELGGRGSQFELQFSDEAPEQLL